MKALHADLVQAMDDLGDEFPDIAKKLNAERRTRAPRSPPSSARKAIQELIKVGNEFKAKGYNLNLTAPAPRKTEARLRGPSSPDTDLY